jgi:heme-degrading monooxygenase HmoA
VLRRGDVVTRTSPAGKCRRRVNQIAREALSRQPQEAAMSIVRLIHIKIDPTEMDRALRVWKTECAPLMIQQKGCISEKLLRCREAHELISYSEWDSETDIELYRASDAHKEIVRHARALKGSKAEVKLYDLVT